MLFSNDSCEENCNSKAFVDNATAGRHRGLTTMYINEILFHQSKLGRDVELQNMHNVLFKSPRNVMQVSTLSAQLTLVSQLVDCYRDATSLPYGHFLIDLSPQTDDRLRSCTKTGSFPSKFHILGRLKQFNFWARNTKISLFFKCSNHFATKENSFPSVLPKVFIRCLRECIVNLLKKNLQRLKTPFDKISRKNWIALSRKNHLEAKKGRSGVRRRVTTH